jgi:hypothetical protein
MKKNTGPGRPKYTPVIPKGKFTFTDLEIANGVNPKTGKGKDCTTLTLRKWLKRELAKRGHSAIVHLKDTFADPTSKHGLGRKQYVYQRRAGVTIAKPSAPAPKPTAVKATKTAKAKAPKRSAVTKAPATVIGKGLSKATENYEAQKAAILAPVASIAPAPMVVAPPMLVDKTGAAPTPDAEQAPVPVTPTAQPEAPEAQAEAQPAAEEPQPIVLSEGTEEGDETEGQPIPVGAPALVG